MNARLAIAGLSLCIGLVAVVVPATARAQSDTPIADDEIRREISELKELLHTATQRLEELERRLDHVGAERSVQFQDWGNLERPESYLQFPIDVERAMMAPIPYQRGGLSPGGIPTRDVSPFDLRLPVPLTETPSGLPSSTIPGQLDVPKLRR